MKILKLLSLTFVSVVCCVMAHAQERTDLGVLSNDDSWLPYPEYSDRQGWETLVGNHAEFLIKAYTVPDSQITNLIFAVI